MAPGKRILVVEDDPLLRWAVVETLRAERHRVDEAADAASAIRILTADPAFDRILLDLFLPDCTGLDCLARLHALAPTATITLMTAHATPERLAAASQLGASGVLNKPFDMHTLSSVVAPTVH